jgi:hypothetical protein
MQLRVNEIRHAAVFDIFKSMGYQLENYSIFDIGTQHAISDKNSFLPVHSRMLTDKILHNRIIRTSGRLLQKGKFAIPFLQREYLYRHDRNNKYAENMILESLAEKKTAPVFCYAHFMMPHGPFYRDSMGAYNPEKLMDDRYNGSKELFLSYLKYTNSVIQNLVTQIAANDPGAVMLIMSDHGNRYFDPSKPHNPYNNNNICAVYFPGGNYAALQEKWSTVNFFRYLFNVEFGQDIPYLEDRVIVVKE